MKKCHFCTKTAFLKQKLKERNYLLNFPFISYTIIFSGKNNRQPHTFVETAYFSQINEFISPQAQDIVIEWGGNLHNFFVSHITLR